MRLYGKYSVDLTHSTKRFVAGPKLKNFYNREEIAID